MNLLSWALFGLIVGIVANAIDPAPNEGGLLGTVLLGVAGALVGGFFANLLFGVAVSGFDLISFIVAVAGSLVVLFGAKALRRA
jgi:uncharacterized membrane protein YeaQ/YmgE (transglycosylase-associated protein family)